MNKHGIVLRIFDRVWKVEDVTAVTSTQFDWSFEINFAITMIAVDSGLFYLKIEDKDDGKVYNLDKLN